MLFILTNNKNLSLAGDLADDIAGGEAAKMQMHIGQMCMAEMYGRCANNVKVADITGR